MKNKKSSTKPVNPNALKLAINKSVLEKMATALASVNPSFDRKEFISIAPQLETLELKGRVALLRDQLRRQLPQSYPKALKILLASAKAASELHAFALWPYTDFVQTYGLEHIEISLLALKKLTPLSSAEFAVRPFLAKHPKETLKFLNRCAESKDVHIRRWASEGTRPRLPWGTQLSLFIQDPQHTLPLLEKLKEDPELYVRKSVANHLNDIAKDHPDIVIELLQRWKKHASAANLAKITWIVHRSLRNLIKQGDPGALKLIHVDPKAQVRVRDFKLNKRTFQMNDRIEFSFQIESLAKKPQKLVVDYIIHHVKANQKTTPKIFKLKTLIVHAGRKAIIQKSHALRLITTRKYHAGIHRIEIQVNGKIQASHKWVLDLT